MSSILRIADPNLSDDSIDKYEDIEYEPVAGTNLNSSGADIRLTIETQDIFTHPSESFLIIEGQLVKDNNNTHSQLSRTWKNRYLPIVPGLFYIE